MAIINGSENPETLQGTAGADTINGFGGNDWLIGLAGADDLVGGDGIDIATYFQSAAAVSINLATGLGGGGDAEGDILDGIEHVGGSNHNDILIGDAGANQLRGFDGNDILEGGAGADTIYGDVFDGVNHGGSGIDTVQYSGSSAAVAVNLLAGTASGGDAAGDVLVDVENLTGSNFGDNLVGNDGANRLDGGVGNDRLQGSAGADVLDGGTGADWLIGGAGADHLIGGDGIDIATYFDSSAAVSVSLATGLGSGGEAAGDTLDGIERVGGSNFNDTLIGDAGANQLRGFGGNDVIEGGAGADTIYGDLYDGTTHGGTGIDTVQYNGSSAAVVVNLLTGTASGGDAAGDVLVDVENLAGSNFGDTLTGNAGANRLDGHGGNDVLDSGAGADVLNGDDGDDVLRGGSGADSLNGGNGTDTASYYSSSTGVTANLATGIGSGGDAAGDTYASVENINGSQGNDSLNGNAGANGLQGWGGDDVLRGGAGADMLDGGAGTDLVSYWDSAVGVNVNLLTGLGSGGEAQGDSYVAIENLNGSQGADTLVGNGGVNVLNGFAGADTLRGGGARDQLTGGAGADSFVYGAIGDSPSSAAGRDLITDFSHAQGDRIDLSLIDADTGVAGDQAFTFLGTGLFTGVAGQLHTWTDAGNTIVSGDVNGDKVADFAIALTGVMAPVAGDFVL
jgi:Ca2+-binding RTX toxin-like protein